MTEVQKKYKGQWVAFLDNETTVVGSGKTAKEALEAGHAAGYPEVILEHMPEELMTYIGGYEISL